jgi:hypothetical protein
MRDLGSDQAALATLISAGARTSAELASHQSQLRSLLDNAASTIDELAAHARAQQQTLQRFPAALGEGRATLAQLDHSLSGIQQLVDDLRPGALQLRETAPSIASVSAALRRVAPLATAMLSTGKRAAPLLSRFLAVGTPFMGQLGSVLGGLAPMVACLRPYGPEIAGAQTGLTSETGNYDSKGHYLRAIAERPPFQPGTTLTSKQIVQTLGSLVGYAMPRPPGLNVGQPWFQPQCGAGPSALDATKDPELPGSSG